jgi:hypothetical protein
VGIAVGAGAKALADLFNPGRVNIAHTPGKELAGLDIFGCHNPVAGLVEQTGTRKDDSLSPLGCREKVFFLFLGNTG